jgi:hypothetical protein
MSRISINFYKLINYAQHIYVWFFANDIEIIDRKSQIVMVLLK